MPKRDSDQSSNISRGNTKLKKLLVLKYAEFDKNTFWRKLKSSRKSHSSGTSTIRNAQGKVVHGTRDVVNVWMNHFSKLCSAKENPP